MNRQLAVSALTLAITACAHHPKAVVTASELIARSQPSRQASEVFRLQSGTLVEIIEKGTTPETIDGKTGPWFQIRSAGKTGWAFSGYLRDDPSFVSLVTKCDESGKSVVMDRCISQTLAKFLHGGSATDGCRMGRTYFFTNGSCAQKSMYGDFGGRWVFGGTDQNPTIICHASGGDTLVISENSGKLQQSRPGSPMIEPLEPPQTSQCP